MATVSSKPSAGALAAEDILYVVKGGAGRKTTMGDIATFAAAGGAGMTSLTTRVSTEEVTRATADTSLTTRVSTEEVTRGAADTSLTTATTSLTTRVSTEEVTRATADTSLVTRFSTADTSLTTRVSTEEVTRATGDTSLTTRVSNGETRVQTVSGPSSPQTPDAASFSHINYTGIAVALTINAPSGTPTAGQRLLQQFKDNGTGRALTWTSGAGGFRAIGVTLPTTTTAGKTLYVGSIWNVADSRWDVIATGVEA